MTREIHQYIRWYARAATFLPLPVAFLSAYYVRFESDLVPLFAHPPSTVPYLLSLSAAVLIWPLVMSCFRLEDVDRLPQFQEWALRAMLGTATLLASLTFLAFFFRDYEYSRLFTVLFVCVHFLLLVCGRAVVRFHVGRLRRNGHASRVLIIGTDKLAKEVALRLQSSSVIPCQIVGFVPLEAGGPCSREGKLSPGADRLALVERIRGEVGCDEIVIAAPLRRLAPLRPLLDQLRNLDVPTRVVLDLRHFTESTATFELAGLPAVNLSQYRDELLPGMFAKRVLDVVFSGLVLIVFFPLFAVIGAAIWITMGRPILFSQQRVGLNGKAFKMLKFRSMRLGTQEEGDTNWTTAKDPRVTKLGSFLRRYNLDELPQFINVLGGEMSVVGPRPERPYFVNQYSREIKTYRRRHHFKVGITGWAQVNGFRGDTAIDDRLNHDLYYLRNWSIWFDLKIIFMTLLKGFRDPHAY